MRQSEPITEAINVTEARRQWSQLLNEVFRQRKRVIVEKSGIPVAAIVSTEDLERLNRMEAERQRDFAILDEIGAAFDDVPPDELEKEIARAVAEVRAELRAELRAERLATER